MHRYNKETKTKTGGPEEYMRVVLKTLNSQVPLTLTISKCLCVQVCFPFFFLFAFITPFVLNKVFKSRFFFRAFPQTATITLPSYIFKVSQPFLSPGVV